MKLVIKVFSALFFTVISRHSEMIILCRSKVLEKEDVVVYRVLPCLVRLCKKEEKVENRIVAAETLAYLIQVSYTPRL